MDGKSRYAARSTRTGIFVGLTLLLLCGIPRAANAAVVEISGMVAYSRSRITDDYTSMQRRYTGSIDFKFTAVSAFELEYTDSLTEETFPTDLDGRLPKTTQQNTSYHDTIYSFNWVQNLVSSKWIIQPYFVVGGGRLSRHYSIALPEFGVTQTLSQNVTTGTGGLGLRIFLTRNMAVKGELKTYVPNFQFAKWKDNEMLSAGLSWSF